MGASNMPHRIKTIKDFVEPEDAAKMIKLIDAGPRIPFIDNHNPSISVLPEGNIFAQRILKKYSDKLIKMHKENFGWRLSLYTTQCHASLWTAGAYAAQHIDSHGGSEHILFSSVIYLGGDFTGGDILFPNQEVRYHPEPLSAVIFPSGGYEHVHSVDTVLSGNRYTMPMWHTPEKMRGMSQIYRNKGMSELAKIWGDEHVASIVYEKGLCEL